MGCSLSADPNTTDILQREHLKILTSTIDFSVDVHSRDNNILPHDDILPTFVTS